MSDRPTAWLFYKSGTVMAKRGRPRFDDDLVKECQDAWPNVKTRRGLQNVYYCSVAFEVLENLENIGYLGLGLEPGKDMKNSLLTELGRFADSEMIKTLALNLCEEQKKKKRTVKEWIKILRAIRLNNLGNHLNNLGNGFLNNET